MRSALILIATALTALAVTFGTVVTATAVPQSATATVPMKSTTYSVKWQLAPTVKVTAGDPTSLKGREAAFTVYAPSTTKVSPAMVTKAKAMAKQYGGTYRGVFASPSYKAPTLVAAYSTR